MPLLMVVQLGFRFARCDYCSYCCHDCDDEDDDGESTVVDITMNTSSTMAAIIPR